MIMINKCSRISVEPNCYLCVNSIELLRWLSTSILLSSRQFIVIVWLRFNSPDHVRGCYIKGLFERLPVEQRHHAQVDPRLPAKIPCKLFKTHVGRGGKFSDPTLPVESVGFDVAPMGLTFRSRNATDDINVVST